MRLNHYNYDPPINMNKMAACLFVVVVPILLHLHDLLGHKQDHPRVLHYFNKILYSIKSEAGSIVLDLLLLLWNFLLHNLLTVQV